MVFQRVAGVQTGWGGGGEGLLITLVRVGLNFRKTPHLKWEHVIKFVFGLIIGGEMGL